MKRILMRAPMNPFDNPTRMEAMRYDTFSGNSGNLLFVHSIVRGIMTEDVEIDYDKCDTPFTEEDYERINAEYDMFIIPLANAFRTNFIEYMDILTELIRHLDMPCVVVGTGMQGNVEGKYVNETEEIREHFKAFCDAVLEKSDSIGLRGDMTADYLETLGYSRDKNLTVIGCPSMYLYGDKLPEPRPFTLGPDMKISLNCKAVLPVKIHKYMEQVMKLVPDYYYVVQNLYEMKIMFTGLPLEVTKPVFDISKIYKGYPTRLDSSIYMENRIRGFVNVGSWMNYLKGRDLSFGTRIHGNITAVLSGTPAFIVAPDARVLELAKYHHLPHTTIKELDSKKDIFQLLEKTDFTSIFEGHKERFENYLGFLHANGLDTIFDHDYSEVPFDKKYDGIDYTGPIVPLQHAPVEDQMAMVADFQRRLEECRAKKDEKTARIKRLKKKLQESEAEPRSLTFRIKRKLKKND